jgi:hypothetical protein
VNLLIFQNYLFFILFFSLSSSLNKWLGPPLQWKKKGNTLFFGISFCHGAELSIIPVSRYGAVQYAPYLCIPTLLKLVTSPVESLQGKIAAMESRRKTRVRESQGTVSAFMKLQDNFLHLMLLVTKVQAACQAPRIRQEHLERSHFQASCILRPVL